MGNEQNEYIVNLDSPLQHLISRIVHGAGSSIIPPTAEQKKALQDWAHLSQNDVKESFIHLVVDKLELVKDDKDLPKAKEWLAELK